MIIYNGIYLMFHLYIFILIFRNIFIAIYFTGDKIVFRKRGENNENKNER